MAPQSLYDILGVDVGASKEEIKKSYKNKALEVHPDKGGTDAQFQILHTALVTLLDPKLRMQHDQRLFRPRGGSKRRNAPFHNARRNSESFPQSTRRGTAFQRSTTFSTRSPTMPTSPPPRPRSARPPYRRPYSPEPPQHNTSTGSNHWTAQSPQPPQNHSPRSPAQSPQPPQNHSPRSQAHQRDNPRPTQPTQAQRSSSKSRPKCVQNEAIAAVDQTSLRIEALLERCRDTKDPLAMAEIRALALKEKRDMERGVWKRTPSKTPLKRTCGISHSDSGTPVQGAMTVC